MFPTPLLQPFQHGTFADDITLGIIFIVLVGVFFYIYFTGGDAPDSDDTPE